MPWPLSEATPALFFFVAIRILYFFRYPSSVDLSHWLSSMFESTRLAGLQSVPRYLCAACTCGQAIFTARVGEDGGSPAGTEL